MPVSVWFYWPEDAKRNPFTKQFKQGVYRFVDRLVEVTDIPMEVTLKMIPAMLLPDGHSGFALGHCYHTETPIVIHIAAHVEGQLASLYDTIAHEIAHVEQVRDGKPVTERGVKVRARNLVRKVLEET